jgi:hypothetical protein
MTEYVKNNPLMSTQDSKFPTTYFKTGSVIYLNLSIFYLKKVITNM